MPECASCETEKPEGKTDAGDNFWCDDCIDGEDMLTCTDCGEMFPSGDMARGSTHGDVCKTCHNYRSDMA